MNNKITIFKYINSILLSLIGTYFVYLGGRLFFGFSIKEFVLNLSKTFFKKSQHQSKIYELVDKYIDVRFVPEETILAYFLIILGVLLFVLSILLIVRRIGENQNFKLNSVLENWRLSYLIILLSLFFSVIYLFQDFNAPISRFNSFKQAEVACNIHHYVENGFELKEYLLNDNEELKFFSFPFYQWTAALVCKISGFEVEQGGRFVNILLYFLTFLLFFHLLKHLKIKPFLIALSLLIFSTSPLVLYYYRSVHPDPMAIYFSFLSLYHFIKYDDKNDKNYFIMAIIWGFIACYIKNPIYLMIFVAVIYYRFSTKDFKGLLKKDLLIYVVIIGFSVLSYKLLADYLNQGLSLKTFWIFGDLQQRISFKPYFLLVVWQAFELINPLFFVIAIIYGLSKIFNRQTEKAHIVIIGLFLGMITTILVFFNVFQAHDYYHLPFVIIYSTVIAFVFINWITKNYSKNKLIVIISSIILILIQFSWFCFAKMPITPDEKIIASGKFIQKHTEKNSYIFYTVGKDTQGWDPTYLFNSRRKGFNICLVNINKNGYMDSIINKYAKNYDKIYLYLPKSLEKEFLSKNNKFLKIATGTAGGLFLLEK